MGIGPEFSFYEMAEIHQEAPTPYQAAMEDLRIREKLLGVGWFKHNAELSHSIWERHKPWWL